MAEFRYLRVRFLRWISPENLMRFFLLLLIVTATPCLAQEQDRPITFSPSFGVLATGSLLDMPGGAYPLFGVNLDAHLSRRFGFFLDFSFMSRRNLRAGSRVPRFSTAGVIVKCETGPVELDYRVGYGVLYAARKVSTLFLHGISGRYRMGKHGRAVLSVRQPVPNDWFRDLSIPERFNSVSVTLGWGATF